MGENIKRGMIEKPAANKEGHTKEAIIQYGIRTPKSSFDHRPDSGPAPGYVGPSKMEGRSSAIKSGTGQKKRHPSTGSGQ